MVNSSVHDPLIIAHRGASALAPENTLAAFALAIEGGADGVELDVRLSRDGVPVVIHDATLRRTGAGDGVVSEMTSKELGRTSVGEWFNRAHPELAREEFSREVVPALDQVFNFFQCEGRRNSVIYVELKSDRARQKGLDLADAVVQLINAHAMERRVVVVSFNLNALKLVKEIEPSIRTGALFEPKRNASGFLNGRGLVAATVNCKADEILLHRLMARQRLVSQAANHNLRAVVWTVDDPKWRSRAVRSGIHAIITNNPAAMTDG